MDPLRARQEMIGREAVFRSTWCDEGVFVGDVEVHALRGVDIDPYQGEFAVLLGPSGSGKSTLLNILARTRRASEWTRPFPRAERSKVVVLLNGLRLL